MKQFLFCACTALLLLSCSNEPACEPDNNDDAIKISALIANVKPADRTTISGTGTASWANSDSIGLFCTQSKPAASNVKFTASGLPTTPVWTPASNIYWADGNTTHTFLAYYPYASGNTAAAVKLPALVPQTGTINPVQDFLLSRNYGTTGITRPGDNSVGLVFTHGFALINFQITINSSIASGTTLTSLALTGTGGASDKIFTTDGNSTIALSTGAITTTGGTTTNTITVTPSPSPILSATVTNIYIIILPGTYASTLQITLSEGGTSISVPVANIASNAFAAASKYTYTVAISRTAITVSNPTITDWVSVPSGSISGGI